MLNKHHYSSGNLKRRIIRVSRAGDVANKKSVEVCQMKWNYELVPIPTEQY